MILIIIDIINLLILVILLLVIIIKFENSFQELSLCNFFY